jgi:alanine dehydrogenase
VIVGGDVVGLNAAKMAVGFGARVTILEKSLSRMQYLDDIFEGRVTTLMSNPITVHEEVRTADLLVGAVLIPGVSAPKLVTEDMAKEMKKGSVNIDVALDQEGCLETTRATTHNDPTYILHDVAHYCVANMPGAAPCTSTFALTNMTLPFAMQIADLVVAEAVRENEHLRAGVNTYKGRVTCAPIAESQKREYTPVEELL